MRQCSSRKIANFGTSLTAWGTSVWMLLPPEADVNNSQLLVITPVRVYKPYLYCRCVCDRDSSQGRERRHLHYTTSHETREDDEKHRIAHIGKNVHISPFI